MSDDQWSVISDHRPALIEISDSKSPLSLVPECLGAPSRPSHSSRPAARLKITCLGRKSPNFGQSFILRVEQLLLKNLFQSHDITKVTQESGWNKVVTCQGWGQHWWQCTRRHSLLASPQLPLLLLFLLLLFQVNPLLLLLLLLLLWLLQACFPLSTWRDCPTKNQADRIPAGLHVILFLFWK